MVQSTYSAASSNAADGLPNEKLLVMVLLHSQVCDSVSIQLLEDERELQIKFPIPALSHISDNLAGVNEKLQKEGPIYELVAKISMTNVLDDEVDARLSWTTPVSNLDLADPTTSEPGAAEARI